MTVEADDDDDIEEQEECKDVDEETNPAELSVLLNKFDSAVGKVVVDSIFNFSLFIFLTYFSAKYFKAHNAASFCDSNDVLASPVRCLSSSDRIEMLTYDRIPSFFNLYKKKLNFPKTKQKKTTTYFSKTLKFNFKI